MRVSLVMSSEGNNSSGSVRQAPARLPELSDLVQLDHDLRATLADLVAGLQLIGEGDVTPTARPTLSRLRASASMLCRLLEDGLQASLAASTRPGAAPVDLLSLATEMRDRWQDEGRAGQGNVEMIIDPALPAYTLADRVALDRMVANLIWNSQRHSHSGKVTCRIGVEGQDLCLVVSDTGPGFPGTWLSEGLTATPPAITASSQGSGLGLLIARQMAERLGGQLRLRNPPGGGAEVTFRMPLTQAAVASAPTEPLPDLHGLRVLVVDDSESIRLVARQVLLSMGATVEICHDGATALEVLALRPCDALVLDVEMPGFSGLELLQTLGERPTNLLRRPAIVMMTGHARRETREALRRAGADAILIKPVLCPFALGEAVRGAILRRDGRASGVGEALALPDLSTLQRLLQIAGPDAGAELLFRLLDDLKTVEEKLLTAWPTLDFVAIRAQTHILVSVAGAVGAVGLQRMAERLNIAAHSEDGATIKEGLARLLTILDALIQIIADKQGGPAPGGRD